MNTGFVFQYALGNLCTWVFLHTVFLFWGVVFPINYLQLRNSKKLHYAHVISVIVAVVVPLPLPFAHLKGGYVPTRSPAITCIGKNLDYSFYFFVLPFSIILATSTCLLVLVFWTILKVIMYLHTHDVSQSANSYSDQRCIFYL
jgi:uncharacterized membrane protein (UPF0182 family)